MRLEIKDSQGTLHEVDAYYWYIGAGNLIYIYSTLNNFEEEYADAVFFNPVSIITV